MSSASSMVVSDSNSDAESEEYEPEKILASKRGDDGQHFYLIKWVGWNNPIGTGSTSRWFVLSTVYSSKISFRYDHIDR